MKQPADFRLHAGLAQRFATPKRMARERGARGDRLAFAENPLLALKLPAWRSRLLLFLLFAAFVAVTLRALYLQGGFKTEYLRRKGEMAQQALVIEPATRGLVTDRNGVPLAVSAKVAAIAAVPADAAKMSATQLAQLAPLLKMSAAELKERLDKAQVD
ncbi:MAG TPA: hypothetical protein VFR86_07685, partial [Burkholderiaceae bacterium]|nr:hypothetical protein [Burkholderiaceae bacterium]